MHEGLWEKIVAPKYKKDNYKCLAEENYDYIIKIFDVNKILLLETDKFSSTVLSNEKISKTSETQNSCLL